MAESATCCPRFDPERWEEKQITWDHKEFVKDRIRSFFHIPLNFGAVMRRNMSRIEKTQSEDKERIILCDENSLWGADVYISVEKDVPGATMTTLSGDFLSKVFEGPYKDVPKWHTQMSEYVTARGKQARRLFSYYTTCPKCAKKYGKNYVVVLAELEPSQA